MAVSVAGEFSIDPFDRVEPSDPIGQMIGTGTATGDATGGAITLTWNLPQEFAYVMLAASMVSTVAADQQHRYRLTTGYRVNGLDERFATILAAPTFLGLEETTFEPPRVMTLPGPVVPAWVMNFSNTLGDTYVGTWRGLVFDRRTVINQPSTLWRDWIT